MGKLRTGCVGWSYEDWVGPFFPPGSQPRDFLPFYSKVFNIVEVDSTFYSSPNDFLVRRWKNATPEDFTFTAKIPQAITHEKKLRECEVELSEFLTTIELLKPKLYCLLAQMPPSFNYEEDMGALEDFLRAWEVNEDACRLAVELRNSSWFREELFGLLRKSNVCLVWSVNQYTRDFPAKVTADFLYLRFIGDRELTKFDRIQKDRSEVLQESWRRLRGKLDSVKEAVVFSNNHFAGFAPDTINQFRGLAGLPQVRW